MKLLVLIALTTTAYAEAATAGCITAVGDENVFLLASGAACDCHETCELCGFAEPANLETDCVTCKDET